MEKRTSRVDLETKNRSLIIEKIPSLLTMSRLVLSPLFYLFYLKFGLLGISFHVVPWILLSLLVISEVSDILDGYIARRLNVVSDLGKLLDPMADSITRISMFMILTKGVVQLPLILVLCFLYRDIMISTLRTMCAFKGIALAARVSGKIKAILQGVALFTIVIMMIPYSLGLITLSTLQTIALSVTILSALHALASGIEYLYANRKCIQDFLNT